MVMDDQENVQRPLVPRLARPGKLLREAAAVLGFLALAVAVAFGYRWLRHMDNANAAAKTSDLFKRWPAGQKPDFVFLLTGEQFGYNQPCGCSSPQYGGVARRWNFIETELKGRGWAVVPLDLGDVAQKSGPQTKLKYVYSMKALKAMGYHALGVGLNEFGIPLPTAVDNFALNEGKPGTSPPTQGRKGSLAQPGEAGLPGGRRPGEDRRHRHRRTQRGQAASRPIDEDRGDATGVAACDQGHGRQGR